MTDYTYLLPPEFCSGNEIPVERATITRERMLEIITEAITKSQSQGDAELCFCDRMYPDSNPDASCGDCPTRDYKEPSGDAGELPPIPVYMDSCTPAEFDRRVRAWGQKCFEAGRAALATHPKTPEGDVVVTWSPGRKRIVAVTRQDEDHRILSVIAKAPSHSRLTDMEEN